MSARPDNARAERMRRKVEAAPDFEPGQAEAPRGKATRSGDATHFELAERFVAHHAKGFDLPTFVGGDFYLPTDAGIWERRSLGWIEAGVARLFVGEKLARKASDYRGIAATAINLADNPQFFAEAPAGIATPGGFHRIGAAHRVETEPLRLAHRQTFRLDWAPDEDCEPVLVDRMLADALNGPDAAEQIELVWQIIGACLFGLLARHQLAALLIGAERSGKSTLQEIVRRLFPAEAVSAVSPASWGREYFVASLAGKRLNLVGELDDSAPIPAAAFKNITGGGLTEGRHPTHRPFSFVCTAAHLFASNVLPGTTDRSEAFYRRWRIVHFRHRVPDEAVDPELVDKVARDEMPGVLARAFKAAEAVSAAGGLRTAPSHRALLDKWRHAANPVLQWLADPDAVELDPDADPVSTPDAYAHYRRWAAEAGFRHVFGRNHFLDLLDATGPSRGVVVARRASGRVVTGLRLKGSQ